MTGFVLALLASVSWGISDYLGGVKTRSVPLPQVLAVSQTAGMVVLLPALAFHARPWPHDGRLWLAVAAGVSSLAALGLFYSAMARGSIAIVAPVAASGAVLPILVGFARGDAIGAVSAAGIALALAGALGAAWEPAGGEKHSMAAGGLLALAAAAAIGLFFTLIEASGRADPYWSTTIARSTACVLALGYALTRRRSRAGGAASTAGVLLALAAIGVTDALAEILFAVASTAGELGVVAVLSSTYPVVTVALAVALLRERMHWLQAAAASTALAGIAVLGYAVG